MKTYIKFLIILLTIAVIAVSGCGQNPDLSTSLESPSTKSAVPTPTQQKDKTLQLENDLPVTRLYPNLSSQLVTDTRLGWGLGGHNIWNDLKDYNGWLDQLNDFGIKRLDTSMQEGEEPIYWDRPEFDVFPEYDLFIDGLNKTSIAANYSLHFWDKEGHANGEPLDTPRFKSEEQIEEFLEYVRFIVSHFKGRIQYYTLWSEPGACGGSGIKCIEPLDYIELARRTIPVIKEEDPDAKVVTATSVLYFDREYLFTVIQSDVIPMFDVISWHGIYDPAPDSTFYGNYYYEYPLIVEEIKQTAYDHGFDGEFWGTEITWCSDEFPSCHAPDQPWGMSKTDKIAAKYDARSFVMHIGMDVGVGWGGLESNEQPWSYPTVRNLNSVMAGAMPIYINGKIENEPQNTTTYAFTLPNGEMLFAMWTDGIAVDNNPGVKTSLTIPDFSASQVIGIDVLHGLQQELVTIAKDGTLIIPNLIIKDYPLLIRFDDPSP